MTKIFTRLPFAFLLAFALFAGTAQAQKAKGKPAAPAAKAKAAEAKPAPARQETYSDPATGEPVNMASALFVVMGERGTEKLALQRIGELFKDIRQQETSVPELRILSGEPTQLYRVRMAFPEVSWITAEQMARLSYIVQKEPRLADPQFIEKLR